MSGYQTDIDTIHRITNHITEDDNNIECGREGKKIARLRRSCDRYLNHSIARLSPNPSLAGQS